MDLLIRIRIRTIKSWIRNTVSRSLRIKILEKSEEKKTHALIWLEQRAEEFVASARAVAHLGA
jgi:hypothetical protein